MQWDGSTLPHYEPTTGVGFTNTMTQYQTIRTVCDNKGVKANVVEVVRVRGDDEPTQPIVSQFIQTHTITQPGDVITGTLDNSDYPPVLRTHL